MSCSLELCEGLIVAALLLGCPFVSLVFFSYFSSFSSLCAWRDQSLLDLHPSNVCNFNEIYVKTCSKTKDMCGCGHDRLGYDRIERRETVGGQWSGPALPAVDLHVGAVPALNARIPSMGLSCPTGSVHSHRGRCLSLASSRCELKNCATPRRARGQPRCQSARAQPWTRGDVKGRRARATGMSG